MSKPFDSEKPKSAARGRRSASSPPQAPRRPHSRIVHGRELVDDFHWLRERDDPEVIEHLKAENRYAEGMLAPARELEEQLYRELRGRIQEEDLSAPVRWGSFLYYSRTEVGQQYLQHCRRDLLGGEPGEEILLDENSLAQGKGFFRLGAFSLSPDHSLLAYSVDDDGSERYTLRIKDLKTGSLFAEAIAGASHDAEFALDNRTLFYTLLDKAHRPFQLWRHALGTDPASDILIYEEKDQAFNLSLSKTRSGRYLRLDLDSNRTSEVRFLDTRSPDREFQVVAERRSGIEYGVDHHGDHFYVHTNEQARNFRLLRTPIRDFDRSRRQEVIPHRTDALLLGVLLFEQHWAVFERVGGIRQVRVGDLESLGLRTVHWEEEVHTVAPAENPEFHSKRLRLAYSSLTTPLTVYSYDMANDQRALLKRTPVLGGFDPVHYRSERFQIPSADGVEVPVSLVHRGELKRDGRRPLYLYGYGAYGHSIDPAFAPNRLSLLDRGFVFAIAHVRGGDDLGRDWYEQGKLLQKKNSFDDFQSAAEHLVREGYTSADRLVISGASAGGLLIGAAVNRRPELFRCAVAKVPFVDIINTMLDPSLPLTVVEYEEWGNPQRREDFEYMLSYSPYDGIRPARYPDILATAGLNDPRVQYWEPAKWIARLRRHRQGASRLLLKTNLDAGHAGASGRFELLREVAFEYAFVLTSLGDRELAGDSVASGQTDESAGCLPVGSNGE